MSARDSFIYLLNLFIFVLFKNSIFPALTFSQALPEFSITFLSWIFLLCVEGSQTLLLLYLITAVNITVTVRSFVNVVSYFHFILLVTYHRAEINWASRILPRNSQFIWQYKLCRPKTRLLQLGYSPWLQLAKNVLAAKIV